MSKKHKKQVKRELSPYELGQVLMGLAGITQYVERDTLKRIAVAFSIFANFPEIFSDIPLTRIVKLFLDDETEECGNDK